MKCLFNNGFEIDCICWVAANRVLIIKKLLFLCHVNREIEPGHNRIGADKSVQSLAGDWLELFDNDPT